MAADEVQIKKKRGPETPSSANLLQDDEKKRLPEYSTREEEFIGENYLETNSASVTEPAATNGLDYLHEGSALLKWTRRNGVPHFKFVQLSSDNTYLRWYSKRKAADKSTIMISDITAIQKGQQTDVFKRSTQPQLEVASFSIVYNDGSDTFDVVAKGSDEAEIWFETLNQLFERHQNGVDVTTIDNLPVQLQYVDRYRCGNRELLTRISGNTSLAEADKKILRKEISKASNKLKKITKIMNKSSFSNHPDCASLVDYFQELQERKGLVDEFLGTSTNDKISRSDVWRLNVDCDVILEKSEVCAKELS